MMTVRRRARGERVIGHVDTCVGRRVGTTEAHPHRPPVPHIWNGTSL